MAGRVPAIHAPLQENKDVDHWDKPGDDDKDVRRLKPLRP
jgi:hypothetical protein